MSTRDLELSARRERAMSIEFRADGGDGETFRAALSSDAPIRIWSDLDERLVHTAEAVDLSRAVGGLPLLFAHDQRQPIGRVDNLTIEGGVLRGDFTFAPNAKAQEIRADVAGGFLRNVSIGYRIHEWIEKDDGRLIEATRWELLEASIVSVPADPSVGLNRAAPAATMQRGGTVEENTGGAGAPDFGSAQEIARRQGIEEGRRAETERRNAIEALFIGERFQAPEFLAIRAAALADGRGVDWAKDELLRAVGAGVAPIAQGSTFTQSPAAGAPRFQGGDDAIEKFMRGAELQISVRAGLETDKAKVREARDAELGGMSLAELAREYCIRRGLNIRGMNRDRIAGVALSQRSAGVIFNNVAADFANLLENIAGKALLMGYEEPTETWRMIARPGVLSDFRQASRTGLSEFDDLAIVRDGAEYRMGTFSDRAEKIQLTSFGRLFRLSRQAIVNDDLDAFAAVPRKMGRAAARTVGDVAYNAFLTNPLLNQDGLALFVAGHNNLITTGAALGAPGVASLSGMKTLMGRQRDGSNQTNGLNIRPARVVVPLALEDAARTLQTAEFNPLITATNSASPNIHRGTFETVADARLDSVSATQWYAFADPMLYDVIEVGFLDGQQEPYLESRDGWSVDGVEFKVRIDCAAIPLDFRTMVRNNG